MINSHFRRRLESFLDNHDAEACDDRACLVSDARAWIAKLRTSEDPEHEMMLLTMAYLVYWRLKKDGDREIQRYQAAMAAFLARNGGVLKVNLDEIEAIDGRVTSFLDTDEEEITFRFVQEGGGLRS